MLFLSSWAILQGPLNYAKHLLSGPRLPFTAAYFGSIFLTLWASVGVGHNGSYFRDAETDGGIATIYAPYAACCDRAVVRAVVVFGLVLPDGLAR